MNTWMKWVLIITQIGGGFTGIVLVVENLINSENLPASTVIFLLSFVVLFAFVTIAGVLFALNNHCTTPLRTALWLQVPLISSPILTWRFSSGFCFNLNWIDAEVGVDFWFGSMSNFYLFVNNPWGIGVNLFAVLLLILLWQISATQSIETHSLTGENLTIQNHLQNTSLVHSGLNFQSTPDGNLSIPMNAIQNNAADEVLEEEIKLEIMNLS